MTTAATKYIIINGNTLCCRMQGTDSLTILSSNILGRNQMDGTMLLGVHDTVRAATAEDFKVFRHVLPRDFSTDPDPGYCLTAVEASAEQYRAMIAADEVLQRELTRVYGPTDARSRRYNFFHADPVVEQASIAYYKANDLWRKAMAKAPRKATANCAG